MAMLDPRHRALTAILLAMPILTLACGTSAGVADGSQPSSPFAPEPPEAPTGPTAPTGGPGGSDLCVPPLPPEGCNDTPTHPFPAAER